MPLRVSILSIMCTNDVHEHTGLAYTLLFISKNKDERSGGTVEEMLFAKNFFEFHARAIFQFCQNGTFEPVHEIQNFFWPKVFF